MHMDLSMHIDMHLYDNTHGNNGDVVSGYKVEWGTRVSEVQIHVYV